MLDFPPVYPRNGKLHQYVQGFLHCAQSSNLASVYSEGETPILCNNEKIRFLYNKMFSLLSAHHEEVLGQIVPAFGALHNATSVQAKICEAAGALGLIFHNRISFMW